MSRRLRRRAKKRAQKKALLLCGIALAVVLAVFLIGYFSVKSSVNKVAKDTIWDNISIDGIDVSGMKADEAKKALTQKLKEYQKQEITVNADGTKAAITLKDLGFDMKDIDKLIEEAVNYGKEGSVWSRRQKMKALENEPKNFEVTFTVDEKVAGTTITKKIPHLDNEAVNATIKLEDGVFTVTEGKSGKKIDLKASTQVIANYFEKDWVPQAKDTIQLVTVVDEPDIKAEDLKKIKDELGTFSTTFVSGSNRGKNIKHAASLINGTVLMPGEVLSASDAMGSRTKENGYLEAGSYLDGQTVQTYGGGVCQVSTTLYNAVILAELEITERWAHSMSVDYVKPSMDAAISEGYKDLKIKNNTDAPVYIEGYTTGGKLTFTVYGENSHEEGRKVSYVSEVTSKIEAKKKFVASGDPVGTLKKSVSGHDAIKAKLWKVVTVNGSEVSREAVNSSNYQSSKATWTVGVGTDNAQAKKILTDAIATQDEAKIKAAIAQAKDIIAKASQPTTNQPVAPAPGTTPNPAPTPEPTPTPGAGDGDA